MAFFIPVDLFGKYVDGYELGRKSINEDREVDERLIASRLANSHQANTLESRIADTNNQAYDNYLKYQVNERKQPGNLAAADLYNITSLDAYDVGAQPGMRRTNKATIAQNVNNGLTQARAQGRMWAQYPYGGGGGGGTTAAQPIATAPAPGSASSSAQILGGGAAGGLFSMPGTQQQAPQQQVAQQQQQQQQVQRNQPVTEAFFGRPTLSPQELFPQTANNARLMDTLAAAPTFGGNGQAGSLRDSQAFQSVYNNITGNPVPPRAEMQAVGAGGGDAEPLMRVGDYSWFGDSAGVSAQQPAAPVPMGNEQSLYQQPTGMFSPQMGQDIESLVGELQRRVSNGEDFSDIIALLPPQVLEQLGFSSSPRGLFNTGGGQTALA